MSFHLWQWRFRALLVKNGRRWESIRWSSTGLRVLFCGSDVFSAIPLTKLREEQAKNSGVICSIDVVCKKGKPSGSGMKKIRHMPIKKVAMGLGLPVHEIKTFTGWSPPSPFNLIVAVSFGLKVPPRLLDAARYGGVNLHPSLLPDLRGPAPLHHALLQGYSRSGVTLQTLHREHFDHGLIIQQKEFELPNGGNCTFEQLRDYVSPLAAEVLVDAVRTGALMRPEEFRAQADHEGAALTHARKIVPEDGHVDWHGWSTARILQTQRALGDVWSTHWHKPQQKELRIKWHEFSIVSGSGEAAQADVGAPVVVQPAQPQDGQASEEARVVIASRDGQLLSPKAVTVEGRKRYDEPVKEICFVQKA